MSTYSFSWNEGKSKSVVEREKEIEKKEAVKLRDEAADTMMYLLEINGGKFYQERKAKNILGPEIYESILVGFGCSNWAEAIKIMRFKYPHLIRKIKEQIVERDEEKIKHISFSDNDLFELTARARKIIKKSGRMLSYNSLGKSIMLGENTKSPTLFVWKKRWGFNASQVNYALDLYESGLKVEEILARNIFAETRASNAKVAEAEKAQSKLRQSGVKAVEPEVYYNRAVGKYDEQIVCYEVRQFAKELGRVPLLRELEERSKKEADFPSITTIKKYLSNDWRSQIKHCL